MVRGRVRKPGRIGKSRSFGNCFMRPRIIWPTGNRSYEQTRIERESLQAAVAEKLSPDYASEIEAHFEFMADNYFRASDLPEIVEHLKLFRRFLENVSSAGNFPLPPAIKWKIVPEQGHSVVTFCTWERERLLAKVAGSFSVVPLNILSADVFPRGDNVVLGIFRVCDTKARPVNNPRDFELVEQTLQRRTRRRELRFPPVNRKGKAPKPSSRPRD